MKQPSVPYAEERSFGRGVGGVLVLIALYDAWRGRPTRAIVFGVVGLVLLALSSLAPGALKLPSRAWWTFARALGWVNSRVLLTVFFAFVLVPTGVVLRILKRDPLDRHGSGSSWQPVSARRERDHYERMF